MGHADSNRDRSSHENATVYAPLHLFPTAQHLAPLAEGAEIEVDDAAEHATLTWPTGLTIRLTRMPDDRMGEHLSGFVGYVRENGGGEGLAIRVLSTLSVYGIVIEPGFDDQGVAMGFVGGLVNATDGLAFLGRGVHDRTGRDLLFSERGTPRPDALRVARRALVLLALSFRGLLDQDAGTPDEAEADALRQKLVAWLRATEGLVDEAEPGELALLDAPIGSAHPQAVTNGVWRAEGAQVLLWALGVRPLPAHDVQEHPYDVAKQVGILSAQPSPLLASPTLRSDEELDWMRRRLLAIHWRTTEQRVSPGPFDFRAFAARESSFVGGFDLADIALAGDDLAVRGAPIAEAPRPAVGLVSSTAMERHHAINWLIGAHPIYSRVVTPT